MNIVARPWEPQDLIDDLQMLIDEEPDNYLNHRRATMCMARDYLKEHFAEPRWISVEERLPEESGRYIVLRKSGDCLDCCYEKERDSWGVLIDMGEAGALWVAYNGVTHWMPLPDVPEVEV